MLSSGTSGATRAALQGVKGEASSIKGLLRPMYCPIHCPPNGETVRVCAELFVTATHGPPDVCLHRSPQLPTTTVPTATNRSGNRSSVPGSGPLGTTGKEQIRHVALQQLLFRSAPRKSPGHVFAGRVKVRSGGWGMGLVKGLNATKAVRPRCRPGRGCRTYGSMFTIRWGMGCRHLLGFGGEGGVAGSLQGIHCITHNSHCRWGLWSPA